MLYTTKVVIFDRETDVSEIGKDGGGMLSAEPLLIAVSIVKQECCLSGDH